MLQEGSSAGQIPIPLTQQAKTSGFQAPSSRLTILSILFPMYSLQAQEQVCMQPPHSKQQAISLDMQVFWEEEPQLHGEELSLISLQAKADSNQSSPLLQPAPPLPSSSYPKKEWWDSGLLHQPTCFSTPEM